MTTANGMRAAALLALFVLPLEAKTVQQHMAWHQLPADLAGKQAKVELVTKKSRSGKLISIDGEGLLMERRGKQQRIVKAEVASIELARRKPPKWSLIGAGIGAGASAPLLAIALILQRNEGGINSGKIVAGTAVVMAGAALLGFVAGHAADQDRTVIHITAK